MEGAVGLEHEEAHGVGQPSGQATGVVNLAASDEQTHEREPYCPFRTRSLGLAQRFAK